LVPDRLLGRSLAVLIVPPESVVRLPFAGQGGERWNRRTRGGAPRTRKTNCA
jgi:hypothetical protein